MDRKTIRNIVIETVRELQRNGLLRTSEEVAYTEAKKLLAKYYQEGEQDGAIRLALKDVELDPYFKIIPLSFSYGKTNENIAEYLDVDTTTISRNKKRLCLTIYAEVQG